MHCGQDMVILTMKLLVMQMMMIVGRDVVKMLMMQMMIVGRDVVNSAD